MSAWAQQVVSSSAYCDTWRSTGTSNGARISAAGIIVLLSLLLAAVIIYLLAKRRLRKK